MAKAKVRTLLDLTAVIDSEFGWRKRELSYLKTAIRKYESEARATYLRASVSLLYAHWEGFVVACLRAYVNYVNQRKQKLHELVPALRVGGVWAQLSRVEHEATRTSRAALLVEYDALLAKVSNLREEKLIDAESNLNSGRFLGLIACSGLDQTFFVPFSNFLDESLVARRNAICHGESLNLELEAYEDIEKQVLSLMEKVKDQSIKAAQDRDFLV